jgi:hypothetical protein
MNTYRFVIEHEFLGNNSSRVEVESAGSSIDAGALMRLIGEGVSAFRVLPRDLKCSRGDDGRLE